METRETRLKRIRMRAWHRGIKEMDLILGGWADRNLDGADDAVGWTSGGTRRVVARRGRIWVELATDLSATDTARVVDTLRPSRELR